MVTWKVRSCPRCGGDVFIDRDLDNWYEQCLQCSYRCDLKRLAQSEKQPSVVRAGTRVKRRSG